MCCKYNLTGEWSDDRSKQDVAADEFGGIPFVTQKSKSSGSLFLSGPVGGFACGEIA
jgi:hypothetical protein